MKCYGLITALGQIDDDLIEGADKTGVSVRRGFSRAYIAFAAVLTLAAVVVIILPGTFDNGGTVNAPSYGNENVNTGGGTETAGNDPPVSDPFLSDANDSRITRDDAETINDPPVSQPAAADNFNAMDGIFSKELGVGGAWTPFNREYLDITYDIAFLGHCYDGETELIGRDELSDWINNVFLKKTVEEQNALPTMYQALHELGITKEKLIEANESRKTLGDEMILSDKYINTLYLEESEMKKHLVHPLALYLDGEIYTWEKIKKIGPDKFDQTVLENYLERVRSYCIHNGIMDESVFDRYLE